MAETMRGRCDIMALKALPAQPGKIHNTKITTLLFITCWVTYFLSYMGRYNYAAAMVEIGADMGYSTSQLGLVATFLFVTYGVGQIVGGIAGDYLSPRTMAFCGVGISAVCNIIAGCSESYGVLLVAWGFNGAAQSLIWLPILNLFSIYMPDNVLAKAAVNIQSSCACGSCITYVLTAGLVAAGSWRIIFFIAGVLLAAAAVWWQFAVRKVEKYSELHGVLPEKPASDSKESAVPQKSMGVWKILVTSGAMATLLPLVCMGLLRDGINTWVPEYAVTTFGSSTSISIFLTAFLPLVNLCGVYVIPVLRKKISNEQQLAALMYAVSGIAVLALMLFGKVNLILTIVLFSLVTSSMSGCNTALISLMPTVFARWGRTSSIGGILNAATYVGSALSGYGIGLLAEKAGWGAAQILWLVVCLLSVAVCLMIAPVWKKFKEQK
ncbi:MAG: MFS transporter [Oscillospiraceae bacterium]|nr:MFS transporter [Oscillospiraceae bacterium]